MSANISVGMGVINIRGFSAVELITAVALIGIVAAIALPSWMSLSPTYSLNNSVRQIQSELHSIKMRAAAEGVPFQMAYSQGATVYTIKRAAQTITTKPIAEGTMIQKDGLISFSPQGTAGGNRVRLRMALAYASKLS